MAHTTNHSTLRFLTCGSVDDGKSTLIGRLLYETGNVREDHMRLLERESAAHGTQGNAIDLALLVDGLKAEREQGITIDTAYRYFSTANRSFIIADAPGHERYTRNMATAASGCNLAVILIDATKGVSEQTKRHSFIASLLGIRHMVVAVNKMDAVAYDQAVFDSIRHDFMNFASKLQVGELLFLPISALTGDNVVQHSGAMPWYKGSPLLHILETVYTGADTNLVDMRFPVQYAHRRTSDFRGYAGSMASGTVRSGDTVMILPSHETATIESIQTADDTLEEATASMAVTVTLKEERDISRGDMLVPPGNLPMETHIVEAMLIWMNEEPMEVGKEYVCKHTSRSAAGCVSALRYVIDVHTLHRNKTKSTLAMNDIGRCEVSLTSPIFCDPYRRNRQTGCMILIDRATNKTVAAALILDARNSANTQAAMRTQYPVFWLTGNTGAGKSTLAFAAKDALWKQGNIPAVVLDGDEMRATISTDDDLSEEGRRAHNLRVARLAAHLQTQGLLVIVSVIAPFESVRSELSDICNPLWIHVHRSGLESQEKPYEAPANPTLVLDHDTMGKEESLKKLLECMRKI